MENNNQLNLDSALISCKIIRMIYSWRSLKIKPGYQNSNGKHVRLVDENTNTIFHVKFAREPFKKFGDFYPEYKDEPGESVNKNAIDDLRPNDRIFFCRPNNINWCFVNEFIQKAYLRTTQSGEETYSIPIKLLEVLI